MVIQRLAASRLEMSSDSPSRTWNRTGKRRLARHENDDSANNDSHLDSTTKSRMHDVKNTAIMGRKDKIEDPEMDEPSRCEDPMGLRGDRKSVCLLMLLYILQGIPLGLAGSIPYLLQTRKINYKEQAMFSLVYWPFSVKLLWAPIVDAAYLPAFGRRKSWLVPVQYLIGAFMFLLSFYVTDLIEGPSTNIYLLTVAFFVLNFLAATQDIAVDGWALTMLSR